MSELPLDKSQSKEIQASFNELTQRQALFNAYFAASKTGMGIFDTQFRYVHVNEALAETNGVPVSDHIGRTVREVLPEVGLTIEVMLQSILDTGKPILDYELVGETPKQPGVTRYWLVSYNPLFDDNGIIFGIGVIVIEISDRKKAEKALSESEERSRSLNEQLKLELEERQQIEESLKVSQASLKGIVEIADDAIITINSSQKITLFNQGAERIFGYTAAEVIGQPLGMLMPSRFSSNHQQLVVNFGQLKNQARQMAEFREIFGKRKDGEEFLAEVSISQLEVRGEKLFTAILRDISTRKQIEVALRDNEARLRQFVEYTPIAIAMFDPDLRYIVASHQWLKEFNLSNDIIGRSHYQVFPDVPEHWKQVHQRCLAGAIEQSDEDPFPRADGSTMWLRWGIYPWYTATGEIGGIIMYSEDITKRKQAEELLRQKEAQYRCIFESVNDGISICDLETGETVAANPAQARIHGYSLEEFTQLVPGSHVHPDSHHLFAEFLETVKQGKQFFCQAVDIRKDGIYIDVEVTATPYWQDDKLYALAVTRDISDRKQAQKALSESEERFRSLMEASAQIVWNTNAQGELVTEQPTWSAFTGQTFEQYKGWGWLSKIHPDDSSYVNSQWTDAVTNRSLYEVEFRMQRYDGEYRYMSSRGVPILQADGTIREWMGANTDITERKLAEAALQVSEERHRSLIKATSQIVWTTDPEGRTTELGDWGAYTGQSLAEMADYGWGEAIHPEDREHSTQAWIKALQTKSLYETEFRVRGKDGNYRYFATKGVPILDGDGNVREWMGTCTDIHDRKQAEIGLQLSEERYRSLVTATSQIPWLTDVEGRVTDMPEWRAFTGQTEAEVAGFGWLNAIHPEDSERTAQVWMQSVETKTLYETEYRIRAKDGSYRYFLSRGVPVLDKDGNIREWVGTCSDIHERKLAEAAIQKSEERFRSLITATSQIIWTTDAEGRVTDDLPEWRAFTGRTLADVLGFGWLDGIHPEDKERTAQSWNQAVQTKTLFDTEYRLQAADRSYRYFVSRGVPILDKDGNIREWIGTCTDIHDRKLAEQKVRQTLDLLDLASDAVIIRDMSDRIIYWNRGAEIMYGWQREEVFGQYIHTFLSTTFPKPLEIVLTEFLEQGSWEGELEHTTRNSQQIIVASRWTLQRDESGKPSAQLEINTNITERKQAEAALQERNVLLQSILESTPDMIVVKDREARYVALNSNMASFFSKSVEDIIGKDDTELLPLEDALAIVAKDRQVLATGITESYEEDVSNGQNDFKTTFLTTKGPWRDANGNTLGIIGVTRNITERKQAEIALARAKDAAEAASRAKSEFLANMSHELRTPLNGILGYAQVLQRSRVINGEDKSRIDVIYQCGSHLLTLINDILDLSKIEAQKVELIPSDFHFPAFLQGVAEMCRVRAELKGIQFHYQFAPELPLGIRADEKRLRQVLINLLSNAIKFTDKGSVTFTISYASEDKIRFEVRDTGVGISQEQIQPIFQPFEQVGDTRRQTEGTGLGLAISQKIVGLMDSQIQVQSEVGVGSIFWFDVNLPQAIEWVKTAQTDRHGQIIGIKNSRPKVLIIDDKWENRSVVNNLLSPIGFDVFEALDGQEGWHKVSEVQPDLVITDLLMPKLNGFEVIKNIRESETFKDLVIIVSSASVFESDQYKSLEAGGNDFLPKPLQASELLQKIQKHLQLEWIYEEQQTAIDLEQDNTELVAPPKNELETIFELAMKGNFKGIIKQAALLEEQDKKYTPFAQKLHQLAKEFQDEKILAFIQSYK